MGCRMRATLNEGKVTEVTGNHCKRGDVYARQECVEPLRMVTAVTPVEGSKTPVSVKTASPIPKNKIQACMDEILRAKVRLPILCGDVVIHNVAGTTVDVIATKSVV